MLFIRAGNQVGARERANAVTSVCLDVEDQIELSLQNWRGRRPVCADRRQCPDEKRIRALAAILDKPPALFWSIVRAENANWRERNALLTISL